MLLLVTDTSGRHGSVSLVHADIGGAAELIESVALEGGTFSAQLVPQIASLLTTHGFSKSGIGAFVVISGPGSFTGLRVGLSAIKALAEILAKPIIAVSILEVLALSAGATGKVMAAIDAGRGQVYAGEYEVAATPPFIREQLLNCDVFLSASRNAVVATFDEALAKLARDAGCKVLQVTVPGAIEIVRAAWPKIIAGQSVSPEQLDANYIRAEIFAKST